MITKCYVLTFEVTIIDEKRESFKDSLHMRIQHPCVPCHITCGLHCVHLRIIAVMLGLNDWLTGLMN